MWNKKSDQSTRKDGGKDEKNTKVENTMIITVYLKL